MESNKIEIIDVNHGIANNFGTHIEINTNLRKYPSLLTPILKHELSHTNKLFSLHDLKLDFYKDSETNNWDMLKFMVRHPKSFTQLLPVYWSRKKGFVYDLNMLIMYLIMGCVFTSTVYFGGKYL